MAQFTALPLRPRNTLEIIDTSLKVYKQYAFVLLVWSAVLKMGGTMLSLIPIIGSLFSMGGWFLVPLEIAATVCCVAGAVRGQDVTLRQTLKFGIARYGQSLIWFIAATCMVVALAIALCIPFLVPLVFLIAGAANSSAGAAFTTPLSIISGIVFLVVGSVAMPLFYAWSHLVVIVVCMEEMREGVGPLRRAWDVLRGQWARILGMITVLGLGALVLFVVFFAAGGMLIGLEELRRTFSSGFEAEQAMKTIAVFAIAAAVAQTFFEPAIMLSLALFYLDVRVRQEALDLEWTSYQSGEAQPVAGKQQSSAVEFSGLAPATAIQNETPPPDAPPAVAWQNLDTESLRASANPPLTPLTDSSVKNCPQCGATATGSAVFCMVCGTVLGSVPETP